MYRDRLFRARVPRKRRKGRKEQMTAAGEDLVEPQIDRQRLIVPGAAIWFRGGGRYSVDHYIGKEF
jgi:hypothetical protein